MMKKFLLLAFTFGLSLMSFAQAQTSIVVETDTTQNGVDIYKEIVATYEGRVMVLDAWATWCGPCRMAMKVIDEIKPGLMEKGVAFVYVTGETSPLDTWNAMREKIDGYHYRLTDKQWRELCQHLKLRGIPAYAVFGKDGSTLFSNLTEGGFPGNEVIMEAVENGLK